MPSPSPQGTERVVVRLKAISSVNRHGEILRLRKHTYTERVSIYQADAATRNACPWKATCTESNNGRMVKREAEPCLALAEGRESEIAGAAAGSELITNGELSALSRLWIGLPLLNKHERGDPQRLLVRATTSPAPG